MILTKIAKWEGEDLVFPEGTRIKVRQMFKYLRKNFRLNWKGDHGARHWARVFRNGYEVGIREGARMDVVTLFAFLHDHERDNEWIDPMHGPRAAQQLENLRNEFFTIDDEGYRLLRNAIRFHSDGLIHGSVTERTCWDADRLDLGRVGIIPMAKYLCTETGKSPLILTAAIARSIK